MERIHALLHASSLPKSLWGEAACHVVWLMNRTQTKSVKGKIHFEVAFGKKPDLSEVREWGEKVWVRIEGGNKLGGRVHEGRWMGISEDSKGVRVYWPTTKTVTTKRNIYHDKTSLSVSHLEGEEWDGFVETKTDNPLPKDEPILPPASTETPTPDVPDPSNDQKPINTPSETDEDQPDVDICPKQV